MGQMRNAYKILVGKPDGKRPLRRSRHRWKDNMKIDFSEIRVKSVHWIHLTLDRGL
jgi:hypothetical protein